MVATDTPPRTWQAPLQSLVIERRYRAAPRYAAGGRRSVTLRAAPGATVWAPCTGIVSFQGSVGGGPSALTLDCGQTRATLRRIDAVVGRGARIRQGDVVGVARTGAIGLSARRPDDSYLDPARLLRTIRPRSVPPVVPRSPARRTGGQRPGLSDQSIHEPVLAVDRALASSEYTSVERSLHGFGSVARAPVADVPLAMAGGALMVAVGLAAAAGRWRRGPDRRTLPTRAVLVGAQQ